MRKVLLIMLAVACELSVLAQDRPQVVCGPYVQCVTETGFTVVWVTDMDAVCWVETAPDDGTHFYNKERERHYDMRGYGMQVIGKIHKVRVDGLQPGQTCRYRLMSKGVVSYVGNGDLKYTRTTGSDVYKKQPYRVQTFKENYDTVRFDIYNDVHGRDSVLGVLMQDARENLDFVAFNGDMTSNIERHDMVQSMYLATAAKNLGGRTPLFASRGNHELRGRDAIHWFDYFATPTGMTYYSFRLGKLFFIVLDACEDKPDSDIEYGGIMLSEPYICQQKQWLEGVLASPEYKSSEVRMVMCHIPPELKGWHGNRELCENFVPLLNAAGVDMMICGHIHSTRIDHPGEGVSNAEFPVVCLPNACRSEVTASGERVGFRVFDSSGNLVEEFNL